MPGHCVTQEIYIISYVKVEANSGEGLRLFISRIPAETFNSSGRSNFRSIVGIHDSTDS